MKILHALHNFPPEFLGGTERYVAALARAQVARGHEVIVVAGSERDGTGRVEEDGEGVRVVRLAHDSSTERYSVHLSMPRVEAEIDAILDAESPDVVHVHHWLNLGAPVAGRAAARGARVVVSLHDYLSICPRFFLIRPDGGFCGDETPVPAERCVDCCATEFDGSRDALSAEFEARREFFDQELAAASHVLVPSEAMKQSYGATGLSAARADAFEVLPLGLLDALEAAPHSPSPEGRLRLAFFGNVAPVKGVETLLEAVLALDDVRRAQVEVTILGKSTDDALDARLRPLIESVGAIREHEFDRARLERLAGEADVAVFPGIAAETYSLVVDEALALGLPVVVSDRGAAAERAASAGVIVTAGDVTHLRDVIAELIDDPARLAGLRDATRAGVFTIADGAARLDQIYAREEPKSDLVKPTFDATFRFLPLSPFDDVPGGNVVVLAPHPDDEVIGAGGAVALHAARGDRVTVVHVTDGGASAPPEVRKAEARAAGATLGVTDFRALDFPDGALRPGGAFESGLLGVLETLRPDVLYVPSPFEDHPDHRATLHLAIGALGRASFAPNVVLYEVNEPQQAGYLLDVTGVFETKRKALECFESQRGTLDVVDKTLTANRARTVNVDLPEVKAAEAYLRIDVDADAGALAEWVGAVEKMRAAVPESAPNPGPTRDVAAAATEGRETVPVTCVISTWNKCDDVRENLLALHRQTRPPAEIVVVDNASGDGTQAMIRDEFPSVKLLVTPHDKIGACETFNMGFTAATQPLMAIMDDDVVAPPDWLEKLVTRLEREPETTAMVSSKIVEPGMPEEFISSESVNRERYMATFRGCGTLARTEVVRRAGMYDEAFFIYGNERDLATRVLNLGYRILQYPPAEIFHKTPFGLKPGKRSLYYHVRNFWLYAFKNCSWGQVLRAGWSLGLKGLGIGKPDGHASDATGTIGIDRSVKETPGGIWIAFKATMAAVALLPYCLRHRKVCTHPDFEPPVK